MNTGKYKVTIEDQMFGQFTAELSGVTREEAIKEAKEFYSLELDTFEENIEIVSVEQI